MRVTEYIHAAATTMTTTITTTTTTTTNIDTNTNIAGSTTKRDQEITRRTKSKKTN